MKANERFNQTIDTIEKLVVDPAMDARTIGEAAARKNGIAFRDLSTVFSFLIDTTLNSYVTSRKLDAAYRFLIHSEKKRISEAVEIAGYGDQPSFNKAFKRQYNLTPGEAYDKKDLSLCADPITWELLSNNLSFETNRKEEDDKVQETKIFGVSASDYDRISKINELESFYGLSRMFSEYAYELADEKGYSMPERMRCWMSISSISMNWMNSCRTGTPHIWKRSIGKENGSKASLMTRSIRISAIY